MNNARFCLSGWGDQAVDKAVDKAVDNKGDHWRRPVKTMDKTIL